MADKLKSLIKNLPEVEPRKSVEEVLTETLKRQLIWLWEKRLAIVSGFFVLILGYLTLTQIFRLSKMLGTLGFWTLLGKDSVWLLDEPMVVFLAFLEANPWLEVIYLLFLLAVLGYCLYTLVQKMSRSRNLLTIGILFVLIVAAVVVRYKIGMPESNFIYSEEVTPNFFLEVFSPKGGAVVKDSWVVVNGMTSADSEVFVNDKQISPDKNGNFSIKVDLEEGENPILIVAGNEAGDREIERIVYYELQ